PTHRSRQAGNVAVRNRLNRWRPDASDAWPAELCDRMTTGDSRLRAAVIIPVLNEAEVIGRVLDEVPREQVDRVLVVDGGSTDETIVVAKRHGAEVVKQSEPGYGAACWAGFQSASDCDLLVFLD